MGRDEAGPMGVLPGGGAAPPGDPLRTGAGVATLSRHECVELLEKGSVGRIAFVVDGWPVVVPVNYRFDGTDVLIRTDRHSLLADATRAPARMGLEIDAPDVLYHSGWSVLALGVAEHDPAAAVLLAGHQPWADGVRDYGVRIRVVQLTGRRLREHGRYPQGWD
jgi:hypothetical protein